MLRRMTIGLLSDDDLLQIFDSYQAVIKEDEEESPWDWEKLVHVCRRWRYIIFESPHRLNLQLFCTAKMPVKKLLDIWPALPLVIDFDYRSPRVCNPKDRCENLIAALEHRDRVCQIDIIDLPDSIWQQIAVAIEEPFPALMSLWLESRSRALLLPDTLLNGSSPCLRRLYLRGISIPSLPRLLLSAHDLTILHLWGIPKTGYISPETVATCLSVLTKIESLTIDFQFPTPHPKRRDRRPLPLTRSVLPALIELKFRGVSEYLEVLAAYIDAPQLIQFDASFFNQLVFEIPQIIRLFGHLEWFRPSELFLYFCSTHARITFSWSQGWTLGDVSGPLDWIIFCESLDWQLFSVAQICSQILPLRSSVEGLEVEWDEVHPLGLRPDDMNSTLWLELFHSFTSVQSLEISANLEPFVAAGLQGLTGESATEVLPSLHRLSIVGDMSEEAAQKGIEPFVTARRHSNHPVAVHRSDG